MLAPATMRPVGALDAAALMLSTPAATPTSTPPGLLAAASTAELRNSEAGARAAPARQPEASTAVRPTKLFIGGISRHTTTKQLRDHFSQYGRVLDCVAMRQPDGRPRGFGYVTLDSPAAADRCLQEPQSIDGRIVDMKPAVPEGSGGMSQHGTPATSPKEADLNLLAGAQTMPYYSWPEAAGAYDGAMMPWWAQGNMVQQKPASQALDCVDLLSRRSFPPSPAGTGPASVFDLAGQRPPAVASFVGVPSVQELSMRESYDGVLSPSNFDPTPTTDSSAGAIAGTLSASAPEFFPAGVQPPSSPTAPSNTAKTPTAKGKNGRTRAPLGELTNLSNIVEVDDLLKPFKSPTNNKASIAEGVLTDTAARPENSSPPSSSMENTSDARGFRRKPTGLLLDSDIFDDDDACYEDSSDEDIRKASHELPPSPSSSSEGVEVRTEEETAVPEVQTAVPDVTEPCSEESPTSTAPDSTPVSRPEAEKVQGIEDESDKEDGDDTDSVAATVVDMESLPSVGSALHGTGECKRCNFFPKGRCQNGKDCTFCHFPHDKRKPSRQEKRERRAAWLEQQVAQGGNHELQAEKTTPQATQNEDMKAALEQSNDTSAMQLGPHQEAAGLHSGQTPAGFHMTAMLPQGQLGSFQDEDVYNDESQQTLAYSLFPGVPPIQATKLPGPLPLPVTGTCMDFVSQTAPSLPPGLAPPQWQPEAEASPDAQMSAMPAFGSSPQALLQRATQMSTMPAFWEQHVHGLQQVVTAEPWTSAPLATVPSPSATVAPSVMMCTTATQTADDLMCHQCESESLAAEVEEATPATSTMNSKVNEGKQWSREDLLRLRSGLLEKGMEGTVLFRTSPIAASSS